MACAMQLLIGASLYVHPQACDDSRSLEPAAKCMTQFRDRMWALGLSYIQPIPTGLYWRHGVLPMLISTSAQMLPVVGFDVCDNATTSPDTGRLVFLPKCCSFCQMLLMGNTCVFFFQLEIPVCVYSVQALNCMFNERLLLEWMLHLGIGLSALADQRVHIPRVCSSLAQGEMLT